MKKQSRARSVRGPRVERAKTAECARELAQITAIARVNKLARKAFGERATAWDDSQSRYLREVLGLDGTEEERAYRNAVAEALLELDAETIGAAIGKLLRVPLHADAETGEHAVLSGAMQTIWNATAKYQHWTIRARLAAQYCGKKESWWWKDDPTAGDLGLLSILADNPAIEWTGHVGRTGAQIVEAETKAMREAVRDRNARTEKHRKRVAARRPAC